MSIEKKTTKIEIEEYLIDLVNSDERVKIEKECISYLTDDKRKYNSDADLLAFSDEVYSSKKNRFIEPNG